MCKTCNLCKIAIKNNLRKLKEQVIHVSYVIYVRLKHFVIVFCEKNRRRSNICKICNLCKIDFLAGNMRPCNTCNMCNICKIRILCEIVF